MTLKPDEFIRRFLMHVLPNGFHRIRHCGLLASGTKTETIARIRELIATVAPVQTAHQPQAPDRSYAGATDGSFGTISVPTYHQRIGDTDGSPDSRHHAARRS